MQHTICDHCLETRPISASYCPHCGEAQDPWVNPLFARQFTPTRIIDVRSARRQHRRLGLAALGLAVLFGLGGAFLVASVDGESTDQPAPRVHAVYAAEADAPDEASPVSFLVSAAPGGFDIVADGDLIHQIRTHEGSRYGSLEDRQRAVTVRLDHIVGKKSGRVAANQAGDRYEIVWSEGDTSFRLFDVTEADSAVFGTDSVDLLANLIVDRMNAVVDKSRPLHLSDAALSTPRNG